MNHIVWVYGGSGAGKETFIRRISSGEFPNVVKQFGWEDKNIIPCKESIEYVVQEDNDGNKEKRSTLPAIIKEISAHSDNSVILVKGQDIDLEANRLQETKHGVPRAKHSILFIFISVDEVYERLQNKKWWEKEYTKEDVQSWEQYQKDMLLELKDEFQIIAINGSSKGKYDIIDF